MIYRFRDSPIYPLPPDYEDLSPEHQRKARVNAIRLQETPADFVHAWNFMREYYLRDDPEAGFFPGWYKKWKSSPRVHYKCVHDIARYPYNVIGLPRDFAKSTVFMEVAMTTFLGRDHFWTALIYSNQGLGTRRLANQLMYQFSHNPRILEDFGKIKPGMQEGQWSSSSLTNVQNRSQITAHPIRGMLLGLRPDMILLDDCEFDDELKVAPTELIEHMDSFIHNVVLPMQTTGQTAIAILGTLYYKRCWISRWLHASVEDEPRVRFWNRILYSAEDVNPDGTLLWEDKFSRKVLDEDKERLGVAGYSAQRLNKPGEASGAFDFSQEFNTYTVKDPDHAYGSGQPLQSKAILTCHRHELIKRPDGKATDTGKVLVEERPFGEVVSRMNRLMFVDYAHCRSATSDYVCMMILGVESSPAHRDTWWVLDIYMDRINGEPFFRKLFAMSLRWRVKYICIEAVAAQIGLVSAAEAYSALWEQSDWKPRILPVKYPTGVSKEDRINGLAWRFSKRRLKYPLHLKASNPGARALFHQTTSFTGERNCLTYDDCIDTIAMPQYIVRQAPTTMDEVPDYGDAIDLYSQMMDGHLHTESGLWLGGGMSSSEIQGPLFHSLYNNYNPPEEKVRLWKHNRRNHKPNVPTRRRM